jgi:hypothetical protein
MKLRKLKAPSRKWVHHYCKYAQVHSSKPSNLTLAVHTFVPSVFLLEKINQIGMNS